jgi:hypothetical protein
VEAYQSLALDCCPGGFRGVKIDENSFPENQTMAVGRFEKNLIRLSILERIEDRVFFVHSVVSDTRTSACPKGIPLALRRSPSIRLMTA